MDTQQQFYNNMMPIVIKMAFQELISAFSNDIIKRTQMTASGILSDNKVTSTWPTYLRCLVLK